MRQEPMNGASASTYDVELLDISKVFGTTVANTHHYATITHF